MVVTPQQAARLTAEESKRLKELEAKIDEAIHTGYRQENPNLCLDARLFGGYGTRVYAQLKRTYEQAGWTLKYESDQRDGDFVRLSHGRSR